MKYTVMLAVGVAVAGAACDAPPPGPAPVAQPQGREVEQLVHQVMRSMSRTLAGATDVRFTTEETVDFVIEGGHIASYTTTYDVRARKPDRLYAIDETHNHRMHYNGAELMVVDVGGATHARVAAPNHIEEMFSFAQKEFDVVLPLVELLADDPYAAIMTDVQRGRYVGTHSIDGDECYHLAFEQAGASWQVWIRRVPPIIPRQIVIQHDAVAGRPRCAAVFKDWDLEATWSDGAVEFAPPAGSRQVGMAEILKSMDQPQ